jgi:hypothetical protein
MWWNHDKEKLEGLFEELKNIATLERLCDSRSNLTQDDRNARAKRQIRQSKLLAEIERLTREKRRHTSIDEQKSIPSWRKISAEAARLTQDLQCAMGKRDGKNRRNQESSAPA